MVGSETRSGGTLTSALDLGVAARLLLNDSHESRHPQPDLDVPVRVHREDRPQVVGSLTVAGSFDGRRMTDDDPEVIPTPGHAAGTTSHLWDDGRYRG